MTKSLTIKILLSSTFIALLLGANIATFARAEITQAQAIARVRSILNRNTRSCRINKIKSVTAARVKAGWRVTAKITMSASGSPTAETAVWTVSERNGAVAASQLSSEIENGCP